MAAVAHDADESDIGMFHCDSRSPSTRFLSHYDILLLICELLKKSEKIPEEPWARVEKDLLSMATVCRQLSEPAMDVLWRELGTMLPLLRIIPNFIKINGIYTIDGLVSDLSLSRFDSYARRVRIFHGPIFPPNVQVSPYGLTYLTSLRTLPLVPHLMGITLELLMHQLTEAFILLRGSTATNMKLSFMGGEEFHGFLHSVLVNSQSLTELNLQGVIDVKLIDRLAMVRTLKRLVLFITDPDLQMATDVLIPLSKLPVLAELSLTVLRTPASPGTSTTNIVEGTITFNSLRKLFFCSRMWMVPVLLKSLSANALQDLEIKISSISNLEQMSPAIFECLCAFPYLVNFKFQKYDRFNAEVGHIAQDALHQMLSRIQAQSIQLLDFIVPMNDEDIRHLCGLNSAHSLRVLHLNTSGPRSPSLSCLYSLATSCLRLEVLHLCFNMTVDNITALQGVIDQRPRISHGLKTLTIGRVQRVPLRNAYVLGAIVSQYIDHLFPHLEAVQSGINIDNLNEWCNGINAILKSYQRIRSSTLAAPRY